MYVILQKQIYKSSIFCW